MQTFDHELEEKAVRAGLVLIFTIIVFSLFFISIFFLSIGLCAWIGCYVDDLILALIFQAVLFLSAAAFLSIASRRIIMPLFKNRFARHLYENGAE